MAFKFISRLLKSRTKSQRSIESILAVFTEQQADFKNDDGNWIDRQRLSNSVKQMWTMLGYLDVGRVMVVTYSFAARVGNLKNSIEALNYKIPGPISSAIATLNEASTNFIERYMLNQFKGPMQHIGWGSNHLLIANNNPWGFDSPESFEMYSELLSYLGCFCCEMIEVRVCALAVVSEIEKAFPDYAARCQSIRLAIVDENETLHQAEKDLILAVDVVDEVVEMTPVFEQRKSILAELNISQNDSMRKLIKAIAKVRRPD